MTTKKLKPKPVKKVAHMVFVCGGRNPEYVHETYESACVEAKRLAERESGRIVRVLQVVTQYQGNVKVSELPFKFAAKRIDDEIPF